MRTHSISDSRSRSIQTLESMACDVATEERRTIDKVSRIVHKKCTLVADFRDEIQVPTKSDTVVDHFQSLGSLFTFPQFTQLYKSVPGCRQYWIGFCAVL